MAIARTARGHRHRRRLAVQFGESYPLPHGGFTTNVSEHGLGLTSQFLHNVGARIVLEVKLPECACLLEGRVAWALKGSVTLGIPNQFGVTVVRSDAAWGRFIAEQGAGDRPMTPVLGHAEARPVPPAAPRPVVVRPDPRMIDARTGKPRMRRFPETLPVKFGTDAKLALPGTTIDVSASGLAVASALLQPPETRLYMTLELPEHTHACCEGVVVRARRMSLAQRTPNSFAVRLTSADEAWHRHIQRLTGQ